MEKYKFLADILSSVASIVAIVTVLYSWWASKRPKLKISQFIVSPSNGGLRIYLKITNKKLYPVNIKNITCYKKQRYSISKKELMKPQLWPSLDVADKLFTIAEEVEIPELGEFNKELNVSQHDFDPKDLLFSLYTSHGIIRLKCTNTHVFNNEFEFYNDGEVVLKDKKILAYISYIFKYLQYILENLKKKINIIK